MSLMKYLAYGACSVGLLIGGISILNIKDVEAATSATGTVTLDLTGGTCAIGNVGTTLDPKTGLYAPNGTGKIAGSITQPAVDGTLPSADFSDATGVGAGWKGQASSSVFTGPNGAKISRGLTISGTTVTVLGDTSGVGAGAPPQSQNVTSLDLMNNPVTFLEATPDTGMGNYHAVPAVALALSPGTFAGAYTATVTYSIVSTP